VTASVANTSRPWLVAGQVAAGLGAAMGVGRFAFTPILPLMTASSALTASQGAALATANYAGYLAGALAGIVAPQLIRSRLALRGALVVLVVTLALMPLTDEVVLWGALRAIAGAASALVFVTAVAALFAHLSAHALHLTGWGFGGVGAGIATSGLVVFAVGQSSTWQVAWVSTAALAALLAAAAWGLQPEPPSPPQASTPHQQPRRHDTSSRRAATALTLSYTLEGVGYIIAGTFLVAAIDENAPRSVGAFAWVIVGLAAAPSAATWTWLSSRFGKPNLLMTALLIQAAGVALPALWTGLGPAFGSAVLFGATFVGITTLSLAIGNQLRFPRAVAVLTTGYSLGQILGPLVVTPLLAGGYRTALLIGAATLIAAATAIIPVQVHARRGDLITRRRFTGT
jgi:MFS family permease